ncbi:MAG: hypothetical protein AAGI07_09065 [Bacteroidota bacterium]
MGLDSVELLMAIEKKFQMEVPDIEAEKMYTVGDVTMWFYKNLVLNPSKISLEGELLKKVNETFYNLNLITEEIKLSDKLNQIILEENRKKIWKDIARDIGYKIPPLHKSDFGIIEKKKNFLGLTYYDSPPPFLESNVSRFIECLGGLNFEKLVDFNNISSLFEVKIAVMGITLERCGVEIHEIYWESSFTDDLGID